MKRIGLLVTALAGQDAERAELARDGRLDDAGFGAMEAAAAKEVEDAVAFALASPEPAPDEIEQDIYAGGFVE